MTQLDFDTFYRAFIEAALWISIDENDEPLDSNYDINDLSSEADTTLETMARFFWERNIAALKYVETENGYYQNGYTLDELAGHDLWLTANGHGAGFWDRTFYTVDCDVLEDTQYDYSERFTKEAEIIGELHLYVHEDELHVDR